MRSRTPVRHGEVLLLPVAAAPEGTSRRVRESIVGHSESGHHHVLESDDVFAEIVAANGGLFVALDHPATLRHRKSHDQHRELVVPPGVWRVLRKTEFDVSRLPRVLPEPGIQPRRIPDDDFDIRFLHRAQRTVRD